MCVVSQVMVMVDMWCSKHKIPVGLFAAPVLLWSTLVATLVKANRAVKRCKYPTNLHDSTGFPDIPQKKAKSEVFGFEEAESVSFEKQTII